MCRPLLFYYAGCNLFGQVASSLELCLNEFVKLGVEELIDVSIGHSCVATIIRNHNDDRNEVVLYGHGLDNVTKLELLVVPQKIYTSDSRIFVLSKEKKVLMLDFKDKNPGFSEIILPSIENVKDLSLNIAFNLVLTEDLKLYFLDFVNGVNANSIELKDSNSTIKKVCTGHEHCLILNEDGVVFSFGNGRRGQLGHGDLENQDEPKVVEFLLGITIVDVACGGWHSCALGPLGEVYTFGWNSDGQLGLGNLTVQVVSEPTLISMDENTTIKFMACGSRHTVIASDDNIVYGFGCNKFGQLGLSGHESVSVPTQCHQFPSELDVVRIIGGPASTGIVLC